MPFGRRAPVLLAIALGISMVGIDATIVSVANATLGRDLHTSLAGLQWVTNAYLLTLCILLLSAGRLADRFGRKRLFLIGVAGFGLASAGCALATSVSVLIAWRIVQGAAGAILIPSSLAVIRATFAGDELEKAITVWGGASAMSLILGPLVGGLLVERISWQSVFLLNLPVAALALIVAVRSVAESRDPGAHGDFDLEGIGLVSLGLFFLVFGLIKVPAHGWGSLYTIGLLAAGVSLLIAFALHETVFAEPMLPPALFKSRAFSTSAIATVVLYFAFYGVLFFWTLYLQRVHGDTPLQSGVHLAPMTVSFVLGAALAGGFVTRYGARLPLTAGLVGIGASLIWLASIGVENTIGDMFGPLVALGLSFGAAAISSLQTMMGNAPVRYAGISSGVTSNLSQLGGVLGTAVLGSVLASHAAHVFGHELVLHHVHGRLLAGLAAHGSAAAAQGLVPLPHAIAPAAAAHVVAAASGAFVSGLHLATYIAAGLALMAAPLGLFATRGRDDAGPVHLA
jgi:EmrB/QacA subfamily drug resistance transporter